MSTSSQIIKRVENAVYHEPYMIPILFNDCRINHGFLHSRLRRYVPHRVGIEFECFGDFANQYLKANHLKWDDMQVFCHQFHLRDFSQDTELLGRNRECSMPSSTCCEEVRVSIRDYRQLNGLYSIMKEMAKYCTISEDCGIHIHIDLTKYDVSYLKSLAVKWFNNHLEDVESIFPPYKGTYNKRSCDTCKGNWINLSNHGTVEFRIAPLTFDYEELIVWIVKCNKLVSQMISECRFDEFLRKSYRKNKKNSVSTRSYTNLQNGRDSSIDRSSSFDPGEYSVFYETLVNTLSTTEFPIDYVSLEQVASTISISRCNARDNLLRLIHEDLMREDIDWYVTEDSLVMTYSDQTVARIRINDAISAYMDGGFNQILLRATYTSQFNNGQLPY